MPTSLQRPRRSLLQRYFAFVERRSRFDRLLLHTAVVGLVASVVYAAIALSTSFTTAIPATGGTVTEGIIGTPRFVNPVLAITRADHDMTALLFDGVMKLDTNGTLTTDVAESVTLSEDGLRYSITIREDEYFHDGTQLTAADVVFTYQLIQNPELKSPLRGNWEGVSVTQTGDFSLEVALPEPYTPFIENLTVGIIPRHIWADLPIEQIPFSEYNTSPIGSGAFAITDISFSPTGLITDYTLEPSTFSNSSPRLSELHIDFYNNEAELLTALDEGLVDSTASLSSRTLSEQSFPNQSITEYPLPRTFALFYNQNRSGSLRDETVRKLLSQSIDKEGLVATVLDTYGIPIDTPVPATYGTLQSTSTPSATSSEMADVATTLTAAGWEQNDDGIWEQAIDDELVRLELRIATANTDVFVATAEYIKAAWDSIGVPTTIEQYEQADLVQSVIRPRNFSVLLFGNDVGRSIDLYPFWHSSQREDPGLNVAQYTNIDTDAYLSTLRTSQDSAERTEALNNFVSTIAAEQPATFLYTPTFGYLVHEDISQPELSRLNHPSERFTHVETWYRGDESLWPFFQD